MADADSKRSPEPDPARGRTVRHVQGAHGAPGGPALPRRPDERDESADSQQLQSTQGRRDMQIAHDDLAAGRVDTEARSEAADALMQRQREPAGADHDRTPKTARGR